MQNELRTPSLVDTDAGLADVARALGGASTYYLDTEFESNRSGKTLSVLQVSSGGDIHLVDALKLKHLEPLGAVIARPGVTWVLHAGLQDVELLADHQADDWMRRPLPRSQLEYAASDIVHLPELYRALVARATELGRAELITVATREILLPEPDDTTVPLSLASFRNAWQLDSSAQAALRFLIVWLGQQPDAARGPGLGAKTLLAIASRLPRRPDDIARIKGVPEWWARKHGKALVSGISNAVAQADANDFVAIEPSAYATWTDIRVDGWLSFARAEVCARAGIAPELGFTGRVLRAMREAIVEAGERTAGAQALGGWRQALQRAAYLELCAQVPGI